MIKRLFNIFYLALSLIVVCGGNVQAGTMVVTPQAQIELLPAYYNAQEARVGVAFNLQPGWKIYWRTPGDVGFPPEIHYSESANIEELEWYWPVPTREVEQITEDYKAESFIYKDQVIFPVRITPNDAEMPLDLKINVSYAICKDICIPAEAQLAMVLNPEMHDADALKRVQAFESRVPNSDGVMTLSDSYINQQQQLVVVVDGITAEPKESDMFVEAGADFAFLAPDVKKESQRMTFTHPIVYITDNQTIQTVRVTVKAGYQIQEFVISDIAVRTDRIMTSSSESKERSIALMLVFALLGGLILNVMPCVLPVLAIKVLGVVQHSGHGRSAVRISFLSAALGIIVSFVALGLGVLWLQAIGQHVGWGFHFQEPAFVIFLIVLLTLFTAVIWEWLPVRLPAWLQKSSSLAEGNNPQSHFFSGVLATLLATPCTAPFLGTAVGFALTEGSSHVIAIFSAMGVGMALPYLILALLPGWSEHLPKPGVWMLVVKNILGWMLLATALWLLWVLSGQVGVTAALILLVILSLKLLKLKIYGYQTTVIKFVGVLLIVASFILPLEVFNDSPKERSANALWQMFQPEKIEQFVHDGRVVFIDVTADWCLTCKVNKLTTLERSATRQLFKEHNVIAMQADWTNKDAAILRYLNSHTRSGIPFNVVYGPGAPEGIILPELLSTHAVEDAIIRAR